MSSNDGGQAFPQNVHRSEKGHEWVESLEGMTLRDYFAAKAMQALVATPDDELDRIAEIPEYAYQIADAMLAARGDE